VTTFYGYAVAANGIHIHLFFNMILTICSAFNLVSASSESSNITSNGTANIESPPAPEQISVDGLSSAGRMSSVVEMAPQMVTATMSWLATDLQGNTVHVTSTYVHDKADIDYEPTPSRALVDVDTKVTPAAEIASNPNNSVTTPILISSPAALPTEIPLENSQTVQQTVVASQSIPASPAASLSAPWESHGVPYVLLSWLRGNGQKHKVQKPHATEKIGQKGRIEEDADTGVIDDAYDREQLFDLYKQMVKEYGNSLMFPNINEEEMLFPMPNGEVATGTLQTIAGTSFVIGSATVGIGGPAATYKGETVSLSPKGLVVGSKIIPLQAIAPVNPTDYAAAVTIGDQPPLTLLKPADNPGIMTYGSVTLTAGGQAMVTAGHSILYNDHGEVVVDGSQTIDPSPVHLIKGVATPVASPSKEPGFGGEPQHFAITRNGIVMDGGAAVMNKAPSTTDSSVASAAAGDSITTSFKTVTTGGVVKTIPVAQAKGSASATTKAKTGDAVELVWGGRSIMVLGAFVLGLVAL
jgi:hypothetical protein